MCSSNSSTAAAKGCRARFRSLLWLLLIAWLSGPRLFFRLMKEGGGVGIVTGILRPKSGSSQILIYGMNDIAEAYIRSVRLRSENDVFVAGIIDDNERNRGRTLHGKRVLGAQKDLGLIKELLQAKGMFVSELVLADNSLSTHQLTQLVDRAVETGMRIVQASRHPSHRQYPRKRAIRAEAA